MKILDKHFIKLPIKRKFFIFLIGIGFFIIALISYLNDLTNIVESAIIFIIGILYSELIKLSYRLDYLERKK